MKAKGEGEGQNKGHGKKDPQGNAQEQEQEQEQEQGQEQDKEFGICMHINSKRCQHFDKQGQYFSYRTSLFSPTPTPLNFTIKLCTALVASIPQIHRPDTFIASFGNYNTVNLPIIGLYQHLYNLS